MVDFNKIEVLLDNGHGKDTPGKRSVDNRIMEWEYTRDIVRRIECELDKLYINHYCVCDSEMDVPLKKRVEDANNRTKHNKKMGVTTILISVHINAFGNGKEWTSPIGWSAWTSKGQTGGDLLADAMYDAAYSIFPGLKRNVRKDISDGDEDYEDDFYILKKTSCPAVLTENFFMTNKEEVDWLLTETAKRAIVECHVRGIINYIASL